MGEQASPTQELPLIGVGERRRTGERVDGDREGLPVPVPVLAEITRTLPLLGARTAITCEGSEMTLTCLPSDDGVVVVV